MATTRAVRRAPSLLVAALLAFLAAACGTPDTRPPLVKLAYVDWTESIGMTNVVRIVLEERLGYRVEMKLAKDLDQAFTWVAKGEADAFLNTWLPITHKEFVNRYGGDLVDLGTNFHGCRIGLAVPVFVPIESIDELSGEEGRFARKIWGIDEDAGVMRATRKAIDEYGLDLELLTTSSHEMTEALDVAIEKKEWMVFTAWKPHWKFAKWRLKFLADPKGVYEPSEDIHTVARRGLEADQPRLTRFLRRFHLEAYQLESLMLEILPHRDAPEPALRSWMLGEAALIESWLEGTGSGTATGTGGGGTGDGRQPE